LALSPVYRKCQQCGGCGHIFPPPADLAWLRCSICDGSGHQLVEGAPLFGCTMTLGSRKRGEIVTLGNGDRGRIQRHTKNGTPMTFITLIGDFDDVESTYTTMYPSSIGVSSVADARWCEDNDHQGERQDNEDPMRKARR
jgi:hypothetical protein